MFWYASFAALVWSLSANPGAMDVAGVQLREAIAAAPDQVAAVLVMVTEWPVNAPAEVAAVAPVEEPAEACPACPLIAAATEATPEAAGAAEEQMIWPDVGEAEPAEPPAVAEGEAGGEAVAAAAEMPEAEMPEPAWGPEPMRWWPEECMPQFGEPATAEADAGPLLEDAADDPRVEDVRGLVAEVAQVLQRAMTDLKSVHLQKLREDPPPVWRLLSW